MGNLGIGRTATTVVRDGDITEVAYHGTKVVKFNDKIITLNTGGYATKTTKQRMNETSDLFGLGYTVNQIKGDWIVGFMGKDYRMRSNGIALDRTSGEVWTIDGYGTRIGQLQPIGVK